ncbi:MAG: NADPH:quinone reductase [Candidatus Saccharibacteria bacterium]|nr:NADPH:quinone reductase [Candidatus Saccharibacteria bacterium]
MKAAQITEFGDASVIDITDTDQPTITADQLLVKVSASSINPFDFAMLGGMIESLADQFPLTLGLDIAGTIAEIGANVTGFTVGDRVYGSASFFAGGSGAFAEFAAVDPSSIAKTPDNITDQEAATLPTAGLSALQAVVDNGHVVAGQKVFINGGSGGVGVIEIQIAKALGAYVATTVSTPNVEFVKALGADEVIDYKTADFTKTLLDYDVALENARADKEAVLSVVKDGGIAVSITGGFDEAETSARNITAIGQQTNVNTKSLDELSAMVASGQVKAIVAKTIPLENIADAFNDKQTDSVQGKIVIAIG